VFFDIFPARSARFADDMRFRILALLLAASGLGCSDVDSNPQRQETESASAQPAREIPLSLETAAAITQAYGDVLRSTQTNGEFLFGTSELPEPKTRIRAALFRMLEAVDAGTDAEFLKAALLRLAFFQDDVAGMTPLTATAPDGRSYQEIIEAEVAALAFELAQKGHGAPPS
jgi:hypothetical protein